VDFVRESIDGYGSGGSLCFPKSNLKDFLLPDFCVYQPAFQRSRIPPHIKTYTHINNSGEKPILDWVILTSKNLSKPAWGSLQKQNTQLMIRHYEAGILFLPSLCKSTQEENYTFTIGVPMKEKLSNYDYRITFPLPYKFPLKEYNEKDKPWIWDISYSKQDLYGKMWPS